MAEKPGDDKLIEMWRNGVTTPRMATALNRTVGSIVGRVHKLIKAGILIPRLSPIIRFGDNVPREEVLKPVSDKPTLPSLASEAADPPTPSPSTAIHPARFVRAIDVPIATLDGVIVRGPSPMDNLAYRAPKPIEPPRLFRRPTECCWPIGDPGTKGFRFCDAPHQNKTYCDEHERIAWSKKPPSADADRVTPQPLNVGGTGFSERRA